MKKTKTNQFRTIYLQSNFIKGEKYPKPNGKSKGKGDRGKGGLGREREKENGDIQDQLKGPKQKKYTNCEPCDCKTALDKTTVFPGGGETWDNLVIADAYHPRPESLLLAGQGKKQIVKCFGQ